MSEATLKTRIMVISDTHCAPLSHHEEAPQQPYPPFKSPLPTADLLIHCGDLTHTGELAEYHQSLDMLKEIDAPIKVVIAGNHDLSLDEHFMLGHLKHNNWDTQEASLRLKQARDLWTAPDGRASKEGVLFLREGIHHVDLPNGARVTIYASPYTPEFQDWGFPYSRDEDRFNSPSKSLLDARNIALQPVPQDLPVDIMITHGPPWAYLDRIQTGDHAGCPHLLRAVMHTRPLIHCFGHIHEGRGAKLVSWSGVVDQVASSAMDIATWKNGGWREGVAAANSGRELTIDEKAVAARHATYVDLSGDNRLIRGQQTAMINAAIMTVAYQPDNPPWLIDLDLPATTC